MTSRLAQITLVAVSCLLFVMAVQASELTIQHTFQSGTPARASEVNDNFADVETAVDDNASDIAFLQSQILLLQSTIADLQSRLATLEDNTILSLNDVVTRDVDDFGRPRVLFSGVNVQVINGVDQETANGTGNLIVGFDNPRFSGALTCSDGAFTTEADCIGAGEVFALNHKTGSHNLVAGNFNSYSRAGGVVFGMFNSINRQSATITGGFSNIASGGFSSVSGGEFNIASEFGSSISGGNNNVASAQVSSINGGYFNTASGILSSVSGGSNNTASGNYSSVTGGSFNTASGEISTISGGNSRAASGEFDWAAGSLFEDF